MSKMRSLFGFGAAFCAVLIVLEFFCRFTGTSQPAQMTPDESLGLVWKPDTDMICIKEGFCMNRINEYGYPGAAYPPEKPEGVIRIALVGDSFVLGRYLFDDLHFRSVLEDGLNETSERTVQAINLGFTAANFERMYLYYELFGKKFSPDYVLFFFSTNNLNRGEMAVGPRVEVKGDSLEVDYGFRSGEEYLGMKKLSFLRDFAIYSLLRQCELRVKRGDHSRILFGKLEGKYNKLFRPHAFGPAGESEARVEDPERKALNRAILRRLAEENREGAPEIIIVRRDHLPEDFVRSVVESGITFFDPSPRLEELSESGVDPHFWKGSQTVGHWNHHAHAVVGEFLAEKMRPIIEKRRP